VNAAAFTKSESFRLGLASERRVEGNNRRPDLRGSRILIVEDERIVAASIKASLEREGYVVAGHTGSAEEAAPLAERLKPDLVLMDVCLERGGDGIEAAREIQRIYPVPVLFLTAFADDETLARAGSAAAFGYLVKPIEDRMLRPAIEMALYRAQAERERDLLAAQIGRLRSFLPVCAWCHRVQADDGSWIELLDYLIRYLDANITHAICDDCRRSRQ